MAQETQTSASSPLRRVTGALHTSMEPLRHPCCTGTTGSYTLPRRPLESGSGWVRLAEVVAGQTVRVRALNTQPPRELRAPGAGMSSIEGMILRIAAEVPQEAWEKLPPDLNDNLDHYLYGTPK